MTKRPHIDYWKPAAYIPPEFKDAVQAHAQGKGESVSSLLRILLERDMETDFGMKAQVHHGQGAGRKKQP